MKAPKLAFACVVVGALMSASAQAQSFKFLCNGIDASNQVSSDGCACSASSAARWEPAVVAYSYDKQTLPGGSHGVSSSRWNNEIAEARSAWQSVSSLSLSDTGQQAPRTFGQFDGVNSIYWITSVTEWNNDGIGSIDSILGVTLTPNDRCNGNRGIIEADTVMNGTGAFQWDVDSSLGTLTHEMGHGIGLGHPCGSQGCSELMSAVSGGGPAGCGNDPSLCFDPTGPQGGDIQGIQQLYPAPGAIGSVCSGNGDCDASLCAAVGGSSFCTQSCGTCPNGMVCSPVSGQASNVCVFSSSPIAQPGQTCNPPGCASACDFTNVVAGCNVCLDAGNGSNQCFAGCNATNQTGCGANEQCAPLQGTGLNASAGVCVPGGSALRNQPCDNNNLCVNSLVCVLETATAGFCRGTCDNATGSGCTNTENCLAVFQDGSAACFPAGIAHEGDGCPNGLTDCARGLICLNDNKCHQRCDQGVTCGDASQHCVAQTGFSFCDPLPGQGGEGEGEGEGAAEGEGEGQLPPNGCHITRGNFDCPDSSSACEVQNGGDVIGTCTARSGDVLPFNSCGADSDCTTGLCTDGVCTRPCDVGACPGGYTCDGGAAPAGAQGDGTPGLCIPDTCDHDHGICDASQGFHCIYNDSQHYTCSKDGTPLCACTTTSTTTPAYAGMLALLGLALRFSRRRPR